MKNMIVIAAVLSLVSCRLGIDSDPQQGQRDWTDVGVEGGIPDYPVGINVTDPPYNAAGDGISDDTLAILDAISACSAGQAVFLPSGSYLTTSTISITKPVVLRGVSPVETRIIHNHQGIAVRITGGANRAGIENLHVKTEYYFSGQSGDKIVLENVHNSWVRNIESSGYIGNNIRLFSSSHCEIRDSYIHNSRIDTETVESFNGYGIEIYGTEESAYNLVENNVLDWFRHAMILQWLCNNNVYAYNFSWNNWSQGVSTTTDFELHHYDYDGDPPSHFIYNTLIEGNLFEQGASANDMHRYNLFFRNRVNNGGITLNADNSAIGNELVEKKHPGTCNPGLTEDNSIRNLEGSGVSHGNYITVPAQGISWDPSIPDQTIADSGYLTSKPAWFGDLDWPCYGGDLMPGNTRRSPAEVRYWTMLFPENPPANLQANASGNEVELSWNHTPFAAGSTVDFIICRSSDGSSYQRIVETDQTEYTDTLNDAGEYRYYVRARNHSGGRNYYGELNGSDLGGESDPSEVRSVTIQ